MSTWAENEKNDALTRLLDQIPDLFAQALSAYSERTEVLRGTQPWPTLPEPVQDPKEDLSLVRLRAAQEERE